MGANAKGPLRIDGVALGLTRAEVDAILGRPTTNANPAWARYYPPDCEWSPGQTPRIPVLASFRPAWPQREAATWRVQSLCGSSLWQGGTRLVEVGDTATAVVSLLGPPDEIYSPEPGFQCLVYDGCLFVFDEMSDKVVEVSLRFPSRLARLANHPPAPALSDDALAC